MEIPGIPNLAGFSPASDKSFSNNSSIWLEAAELILYLFFPFLYGCGSKPSVDAPPPPPPPPLPPQPSPSSQNSSTCYYRNFPTKDLPYDYYLWQGERKCLEDGSSCAPEPPKIFTSRREINAFEGHHVRPFLKKLPSDEAKLMAFLYQADEHGQITWISDSNYEVYDLLQREIDSALPEQDVHFVFGFAHYIAGQTEYFNELISEGLDGQKVRGITHLALELPREDSNGVDVQKIFDSYMIDGVSMTFKMRGEGSSQDLIKDEIREKMYMISLSYSECYNIVLADIPRQRSKKLEKLLGNYYWLGAREIFAIESVRQRLNPVGRDVVLWHWGANHAEKHRLPFYLGIRYPEAKVVSIVFNGGTFIPALAFDRALEKMGWLERAFILKLDGYRDADYIIHVPTQGRVADFTMRYDPVVSQLFDPPRKKRPR